MTIWSILQPLEIFYAHLVYFEVIWYIFPRFGILDQEKSGNPGADASRQRCSLGSDVERKLFVIFFAKYQICENVVVNKT
jgi:hypothetical protein